MDIIEKESASDWEKYLKVTRNTGITLSILAGGSPILNIAVCGRVPLSVLMYLKEQLDWKVEWTGYAQSGKAEEQAGKDSVSYAAAIIV